MTTTTKNTNTNGTGSQRKRNNNSSNQSRPNVAVQANNSNTNNQQKKGKQQNQNQNQSLTPSKPDTPAPPSKPDSPPALEQYVPLNGFNAAEIDTLLSSGGESGAEPYKPEHPVASKTGPWGQKCEQVPIPARSSH